MSKTIYLEGIDGGTAFDAAPFPDNELNLQNGATLKPNKDMPWFGLKYGQEFVINYDGEVVRAGGLSWGVEQLVIEINKGFWQVANQEKTD